MYCRLIFVFGVFAMASFAQNDSGDAVSPTPPQPGQVQQPNQLPNTVSAPPFDTIDKLDYRFVESFGVGAFVDAGIGAAIGQARNSPHEWGQGMGGFGDRYASGFGSNLSREAFAFALDSAFHEDPRYFPSEDKPMKLRVVNAMKQVFLCKTDSGGDSFAWARVMSQFGAGQFTNLWQPKSASSVGDGIDRAFIGFGADAVYNLMQEFIPFTRPRSLRHRH